MSTLTWENETRPNGATNTARPLTRSSDLTREGLAVKATRTCSVDDCTKPVIARGWCTAHWTRWRRHGDPLGGGLDRKPAPAQCVEEGCINPPHGRGLCATHWRQAKGVEDPEWRERHLASQRAWQANNPERMAKSRRLSRGRHRDEELARTAKWRAENRHQVMVNNWRARRRAHGLSEDIVEVVYPDVVFKRDEGVCQICLIEVDPDLPFTDPMSATTDHVIPVTDPTSTHSYANTQLAHFDCNRRKHVRTEETR